MNQSRERAHRERISDFWTFQPLDWSSKKLSEGIEAQAVFLEALQGSGFVIDDSPELPKPRCYARTPDAPDHTIALYAA